MSAMRANIWSSLPVSSPTLNKCPASAGKAPERRSGAAIPSPRFTPCDTPSSAPAIFLLLRIAAEIPIDCTNGTLLATRVDIARANRALQGRRTDPFLLDMLRAGGVIAIGSRLVDES